MRGWVLLTCSILVVGTAALYVGWQPAEPPAAPARVAVDPRSTSAVATWSRSQASAFEVEYAQRVDFVGADRVTVDGARLSLRSLAPGSTYFLRVRAVDEDGTSGRASRPVRFTTSFPSDPPRLTTGSASPSTVSARWKPAEDDATYEVELASDSSFSDPTRKVVSGKRVTFKGLDVKTRYHLRARVVDGDGAALSEWSEVAERSPRRVAPLRVASFNVRKATQADWSARRTAVAQTILDQDLDVVGLQEATPITVGAGVRQYTDVVNLLGGAWRLTDTGSGATGEARTIYDSSKLRLVDHGHLEVRGSTAFGVMRYITWATFEQRSTAKKFVFTNTHFVYQKSRAAYAHRTAATRQLVDLLAQVAGEKLPAVVVGDFNSGDYRQASNGVYRQLLGAGLVDPLARDDALGAAERLVNADLKTVNGGQRRAIRNPRTPMVDGIFVTPMRVEEWETVAKLDQQDRQVGTIPSDHHMIRATVYLP